LTLVIIIKTDLVWPTGRRGLTSN